MPGSSLPFGRYFGVEVRVHLSFILLLALSVGYSTIAMNNATRGLGLWLALCFAVLVREVARSIAAVYSGLRLRALFLLPVGGVMAFAPREEGTPAPSTRLVTASAPIANFGMGLLLMGFCYAIEPHISLFEQPWIGFGHILRSFVWMQMILGAVNLLPAAALPTRQLLRSRSNNPPTARTAGPAFGLGSALAIAVVLAGFVLMNLWLIIFGGFMLLGAQLSAGSPLDTTEAGSILVSDVMLTEYTLLSSSDTLRGALERTAHSLQDVFPVVRGERLVGAVSRQTLANRLQAEGDGYLQGSMTRNLPLAAPAEKLVDALRRTSALGASEFIPVVEDNAMLGILTPHSLSRSVQQVRLTRPPKPTRHEQ
ncbi:MAG TPA: CBS domain-containing protein [Acidobacteriaceae bacterium]|jgi:CBS domain-containing protein|nr:CBS domain-containing protein [Acidobacteriaceae bacterium]